MTSFESPGGHANIDPTISMYRDGRFVVLREVPIESLDIPDQEVAEPIADEQARGAHGFLRYAVAASEYLENNTSGHDPYSYASYARTFLGFEHEGTRYATEVQHFRGAPKYTLINMESGGQIRFTRGDISGILSDASETALVQNFVNPSDNDSLVTLSRDHGAHAVLTTTGELVRLSRLDDRDAGLSNCPNLRIAPSDTKMALQVVKLATGEHGQGLPIDGKVVTENLTPAVLKFDGTTIASALTAIARLDPSLSRAILEGTSSISLEGVSFGYDHHDNYHRSALNKLLEVCQAEVAAGAEAAHGNAMELASKIDLAPAAIADFFYSHLARQYNEKPNDAQRSLMLRAVEVAVPQFRGRMVERLREQYAPVSGDISVGDLLNDSEKMAEYAKVGCRCARLMEKRDENPALVTDAMSALREVVDAPGRTPSAEQLAALTAVGFNAELLPLAISEARRRGGSLFVAVAESFMNGSIVKRAEEIARERELDARLELIAEYADDDAQEMLRDLILKGDGYNRPTASIAEALLAELPEHEAERRTARIDSEPLPPMTQIEVAGLLAAKLKPDFKDLFASDLVEVITVTSSGVTYIMKAGATRDSDWRGPGDVAPTKHMMVPLGDQELILTRDGLHRPSDKPHKFYQAPQILVTRVGEDGSFTVKVEF